MATDKSIGPFPLGMDNRVPDFKLGLPRGAGHLLRDALNVDVTETGSVKTRPGFALHLNGTDCHSLWAPLSKEYALYCDAGGLYRMDVSPQGTVSKTLITSGFGLLGPVRFAQVNEAVYFTDGVRAGSYHPTPGATPQWASTQATVVGDQQLAPMPAGSAIAHHRARLLVAVGHALIYSEPFQPNLRDEARGFELFPAPIQCIAAVEAGVFVVADQTYFIADGFPAQAVGAVLSYGGPAQAAGYRLDGGAHWMSTRGMVSVSTAGEIKNIQEEHVALTAEGSAATLLREYDGMRTVIAALSEPSTFGAGVGSYAQSRIIKKE